MFAGIARFYNLSKCKKVRQTQQIKLIILSLKGLLIIRYIKRRGLLKKYRKNRNQ